MAIFVVLTHGALGIDYVYLHYFNSMNTISLVDEHPKMFM